VFGHVSLGLSCAGRSRCCSFSSKAIKIRLQRTNQICPNRRKLQLALLAPRIFFVVRVLDERVKYVNVNPFKIFVKRVEVRRQTSRTSAADLVNRKTRDTILFLYFCEFYCCLLRRSRSPVVYFSPQNTPHTNFYYDEYLLLR
jgi:hypothetical protein